MKTKWIWLVLLVAYVFTAWGKNDWLWPLHVFTTKPEKGQPSGVTTFTTTSGKTVKAADDTILGTPKDDPKGGDWKASGGYES